MEKQWLYNNLAASYSLLYTKKSLKFGISMLEVLGAV